MRVARGRVVEGKVIVEGERLPDGTEVVVVIEERGEDESFHLTPEQEDELLESIREADEGKTVDAWQLLRDLAEEKS